MRVPTRPMRVSCHLITWKQDFEQALSDVSALGFHACEPGLRFVRPYGDDLGAFRRLLDQHSLALSAIYQPGVFTTRPENEKAQLQSFLEVAGIVKACGSDVVVVGPAMGRDAPPDKAALARAAVLLNEIGASCAEMGVRACIHPHLWSEIESRREIDALMAATDPGTVWLCVDSGHQGGAGVDPAQLVLDYAGRVGHVHLKDLTIGGEVKLRPKDAPSDALPPFCELGLGSLDLRAFLSALQQVGYGGWVTVELDSTPKQPVHALRICRDYLVSELGLSLETAQAQVP